MTSITKISELDLHALAELRAESLLEGFRFIERLCEEWASSVNRFNAPGEALFLAVTDCQVVGICGLNRDPYLRDPTVGRVRRLYVAKAYRRCGVARALLAAVVIHARGHFSLLRVRTHAASEFYTAQGFHGITSEAQATHVLELTTTP